MPSTASARVAPTDAGQGPDTVRGRKHGAEALQSADVKNLDTGETFATVQDALDDVDTVNGHTIEVQVASHAEGLVGVGKSVTIRGMAGGSTLVATTDTGTSGDARGWFLVTAPGVTLRDLTFDGQSGAGRSIYQAVRIRASGALVENCAFTHIIGLPAASYDGRGVALFDANATINNCSFSDIRRIGVHVFGAAVTGAVVSNCTYTGKGAGDQLDYGVELGGGAVASLSNNTITNCTGVALADGSGSAGVLITDYFAPGTSGTLANNFVTGNSVGVAAGYLPTDVSVVVAHGNDLSGNPAGVQNTNASRILDASANWWGSNAVAAVATSAGAAVDFTPWLHTGTDTSGGTGFQGSFSTLDVDDDSPQTGVLNRVQEGINLVTASTVIVGPGTYTGNLTLSAAVTLLGAQAGVAACGRSATESILTAGAGTTILTLLTGSAGSIVDGFTFSGAARAIESTSGPIHNLQIKNNRILGFTGSGLFLNDPGNDITFARNSIDGTSKVGAGDLVHLDTDLFNGFQFTDNCVTGGTTATGFFVDGNHNVGASVNRPPLLSGNTITGNNTGMNLGTRAFQYGTISNNTFASNLFDGLQGGIQHTSISGNLFNANGRSGLALTSFANLGADRGGQFSTVTGNTFSANVREGLFFSSTQAAGTISTNTANNNNFLGNGTGGTFDGFFYGGTETVDVKCNWWGHLAGPDKAPSNPNPPADDLAATNAVFWPWLDGLAPGGNCNQYGPNNIAPTGGGCISTVNPCVPVDVLFTRLDATPVRGYSVTFQLSPELVLCTLPPTSSITQQPYLSGYPNPNGTTFQVLDNGGGSYTVDAALLGNPCGPTGSGVIFRIMVKNSGADGTGTVTVTSVIARDCFNVPVPAVPGPPLAITIDNTVPGAIAITAVQDKLTNPATDPTTFINVSVPAVGATDVVRVYRKGFGNYPEYDDAPGAGSVPALPATEAAAIGSGWTLAFTAAGPGPSVVAHEPPVRDFWYFVAFVKDACGNVGGATSMTSGTLNYHLGDVHNGVASCTGNSRVNTSDISFLGSHYGITLGVSDSLACLDVGPTTDNYVNGRPLTDNRVQFEDLILFAINAFSVFKSSDIPAPAAADDIVLLAPSSVTAGEVVTARLWARAAGHIQGASVQLGWDPAVVEPLGVDAGDLLRLQGGIALSPGSGVVDAALVGARDVGLSGEGVLAGMRFRVVGTGDPRFSIVSVTARDARNQPVSMHTAAPSPAPEASPRVTALLGNTPNPFNPSTRIAFALAARGVVDLSIYSISGRRVATLVRGMHEPGVFEAEWNGTDEHGTRVASGTYYARFATGVGTDSRTLVLVK